MAVRVVDSSAVAALVFAEPRADEAAAAMGSASLVAPSLIRYELASVCLKKIGAYPEQRAELLEALHLAERLEIREVDVPMAGAVALAERTGLTVYDSAYLWLARELLADLVTFDVELQAAGRQR